TSRRSRDPAGGLPASPVTFNRLAAASRNPVVSTTTRTVGVRYQAAGARSPVGVQAQPPSAAGARSPVDVHDRALSSARGEETPGRGLMGVLTWSYQAPAARKRRAAD